MSTLDENAKEISEDAAGEATETPSPKMDIEEQLSFLTGRRTSGNGNRTLYTCYQINEMHLLSVR